MTDEVANPVDPKGLRDRVSTLINSSTPMVVESVVQHFVREETDRRAKLLVDGIKRLGEAEATFAGIKPDVRTFDENLAPATVGFSADQKGKKEKAGKRVERLSKALTAAMTEGQPATISERSFKELEEALKQND